MFSGASGPEMNKSCVASHSFYLLRWAPHPVPAANDHSSLFPWAISEKIYNKPLLLEEAS